VSFALRYTFFCWKMELMIPSPPEEEETKQEEDENAGYRRGEDVI
jgi:hypothetical protein